MPSQSNSGEIALIEIEARRLAIIPSYEENPGESLVNTNFQSSALEASPVATRSAAIAYHDAAISLHTHTHAHLLRLRSVREHIRERT